MELFYIFLGLVFIFSVSGDFYAFFTKRQVIRSIYNNIFQAVFWFALAGISLYLIFGAEGTIMIAMNGLFIVIGAVFGGNYVMRVVKDDGAYSLPFAAENNFNAFQAFKKEVGKSKIEGEGFRPEKIQTVRFNTTSDEEKQRIIEELSEMKAL